MDKVKIGQFISECRRDKHITQEQLAEMLGVTNKSVSKWETGICLPDASLFESLCTALHITVSELFAGKRERTDDGNLLQMLTRKLYALSDRRVSFENFEQALTEVATLSSSLKQFKTKAEAVSFLMKETDCPEEECANAYDFYLNLFAPGSDGRIGHG